MEKKPKVLIIDDDPAFTAATQVGLEHFGFDVLSADSGDEAIRLARENHPDAIILDIFMAPDDGFTICRRLRSDSATADRPVLVISALKEKMHMKLASPEIVEKLDVDDFLDKPTDAAVLAERIRKLLSKKRSHYEEE